jgi:fucose permease
VFASAGLGGAVLSWMTGIVSTSTGSLRIGLLVPGAAALLMLAMISRRRTSGGAKQQAVLEPTATR